MKKIVSLTTCILLSAFLYAQSIYNFSIPKIEGGVQVLSAIAGKKILIITLPVAQNASADSMLYALDTLSVARSATLSIIAVPSYEDGFTAAQRVQLQQWYRSKLNANIIITDGLYTRKTSASQQHLFFKWLTTVDQNKHFNMDVAGPGYKFFIEPIGELYGFLLPPSTIYGRSVQKALALH